MAEGHIPHSTAAADAQPSRRLVLQVMALGAAGFAVGCGKPGAAGKAGEAVTYEFGPFVKVSSDDTVTVLIKHIEFGQGVSTGLTTIVAEEIDARWDQMRFEHAPANAKLYNNTLLGPIQGTGGSTAIANSWNQLRQAGAAARAMLVSAAAAKWKVDPASIAVAGGRVSSGDKSATFGELAEAAALVPPPEAASLKLKEPGEFRLIGQERSAGAIANRADGAGKIDGSAKYALDYRPEGALTALVARSPRFGGKVASFDATAAKAVPGVVEVVQIPNGVAVVAKDMWAARKGREALKVEWDNSVAEGRSSAEIMAAYRVLAMVPGSVLRKEGDGASRPPGSQSMTADYEFPYLVHAPLEPLNCVVEFKPGESCKVTSGSQMPSADQMAAAMILGLAPDQVKVDTMLAGGSFGRRATIDCDVVSEACHVAKALNGSAPVKLVWTREDDIRGGKYRPLTLHRLRADIRGGEIVGWSNRIVTQSIMAGTPFLPEGAVDETAAEGANDIPYAIPNILVDMHTPKVGVPVLWWRSVGHTHTGYAVEAFLDEVARKLGKDPVELRRGLLANAPRHLGVLNLAAEKAGWGTPMAEGRARGVAVHKSFNTYVAQVAEITLTGDGGFTVDRVVCAVDCGIAINPDIIRAQMEGGIGMGLSAMLGEALTLKGGAPEQMNFVDYNVLRMEQMPKVEVHIVPSGEAPTGVGEPGVPVIGPAVANAVLAATGKPLRKLPVVSRT